ncbi:MAG: hypothetical protein EBQ82_11825 [Betaproteobacteria bacterium]|nr:hypothetical protein [Betaproteobacteria bacterium]
MSLVGFLSQFSAKAGLAESAAANKKNCRNWNLIPPFNQHKSGFILSTDQKNLQYMVVVHTGKTVDEKVSKVAR